MYRINKHRGSMDIFRELQPGTLKVWDHQTSNTIIMEKIWKVGYDTQETMKTWKKGKEQMQETIKPC